MLSSLAAMTMGGAIWLPEVCRHRFEWVAEWCARRGEKRSGLGVHYVVFPAVQPGRTAAIPQTKES